MTHRPRSIRLRASVGAVVALFMAASVLVGAAGSVPVQPDSGGGDVDMARADVEAVQAEIDKTHQAQVDAQAALEAKNAELEAAKTNEQKAIDAVVAAEVIVDEIDEQVAVALRFAYTSSSLEYPAEIAYLRDANMASMRVRYLEHRALAFDKLLNEQKRARAQLQAERDAASAATSEVEASRGQIQELVNALDELERNQQQLAQVVEDRLDSALAEAETLRALDAQLAAELVAKEQALQNAVVASMTAAAPTTTAPPTPTAAAPQAPTPVTAAPTTAAPTTSPPVVNPTPTTLPSGTSVQVVTVRGIVVAREIASNLDAMMGAAATAGHTLGGSGYRDIQSQINLRRQHCGPTEYDIWQKPSSQCSPPTAIPGRSMHEKGLAVDLTCGGALIRSRTSPCFVWLAANAASYGFYNLPSEPWHWSTNGN